MKLKLNITVPPKDGDKRVVKKFLFFPKIMGNELRWLEFAAWEEEYNYMETDSWWQPIGNFIE